MWHESFLYRSETSKKLFSIKLMGDKASIISTVSTTALVVCALVMNSLAVEDYFTSSATHSLNPKTELVTADEWDVLDRRDRSSFNESVHLVVFSDYECPYCKQMHDIIERVKASQGRNVTVD